MKILLLLLLQFSPVFIFAQNEGANIEKIVITSADKASFHVIADSLTNMLPQKFAYLIGETHAIKANNFIFYPVFKMLHEKRGVNYILKEMNHSLYFGYNLFLKYGDLRILAEFNNISEKDSTKLSNRYSNELALYKYNSSQDATGKIQFIGVDFDISNIPGFRTLTQYHYITAIKYLKTFSQETLPYQIDKLFQDIITADVNDVKLLMKKDKELAKLSIIYQKELKVCFGDFYKDFYIIVNSFKSYPSSGRRDPGMVDNLENAYQLIKESAPNVDPKFFGSFGAVHVIPGNNGSFASQVNKSSLMKGGVAFIGASYFNSTTTYAGKVQTVNKSALGGLTNEEEFKAESLLKKVSEEKKLPITLLGRFKDLHKGEFDFLKGFDAIFVFTGF